MTIKVIEILTTHSNGNKKVLAEITCDRCSGNGRIEKFSHINNGICLKCNGLGVEQKEIKVDSNEVIEMIQETVTIKPLVKVDYEALRLKNAMIRINEEKKATQQAYKELVEREAREQKELDEDIKNNPDNYSFSWED